MAETEFWIKKASGARVPFSIEKLEKSLKRAGAEPETIAKILPAILARLHEGITTREVYKKAYQMLKSASKQSAGRYKLKNALQELGPSGFPFERFVGELFRLQGYQIEVGVVVQGACVTHEVDILASKEQTLVMVECKYHNKQGINTDVKIPLYVHARFQDIIAQRREEMDRHHQHFEGWLVTNTRFSDDAMRYGSCIGLNLLAWDYPENRGLRELIMETGAHPITCMSSLTAEEKRKLLENMVVMCTDLLHQESMLHQMGIATRRVAAIMQEAERIASR